MAVKKILGFVLVLSLLFSSSIVWAGYGKGSGGSAQQSCGRKLGFFEKLGRSLRLVGAKIKNAIMDFGVNVKYKLTGRKCRVWVCGYYDRNGRYVRGHWRYIRNCGSSHGKSSGKGNISGQGHYPGGQHQGQTQEPLPPLPPVDQPSARENPSETAKSDESAATSQPSTSELPPAQSQHQHQGKRTLGMLMNDLVEMSEDINQLKRQAMEAKKSNKTKILQSVTEDYIALADDREIDAKRLVKVVTQDLYNNKGNAGIYYSAFIRNLSKMQRSDRELIRDVIDAVEDYIQSEAAESGKNSPFHQRLKEIRQF